MTNGSEPPRTRRKVRWPEHEISNWIVSRIRGEQWHPSGEIPENPSLIGRREVLRRCSISNTQVWALERAGKFPRRVALDP